LNNQTPKNHCGFVAIVGRPNAGKSTLINQLIGLNIAITSHKPQTTRHRITGINTLKQGQIIYLDTPGIHRRGDKAMNKYLNKTAKTTLGGVDLIIFIVEALVWTDEDEDVLTAVIQSRLPVILVVNKVDLVNKKEALLPYLTKLHQRHNFELIFPVSALRDQKQVKKLEQNILPLLPENDNLYPDDQLTDRPERFFASEFIREQLTRRNHKELPYALTVEIESFEESPEQYKIAAVIWVEKNGQKQIIIGKKGAALKITGTEARKAMEKFYGKKVYLNLWVKVMTGWSSGETALARLGYGE